MNLLIEEASIFSGFRHGAHWSAAYNFPSSLDKMLDKALAQRLSCKSGNGSKIVCNSKQIANVLHDHFVKGNVSM